jgi:hypothetical protein
MAQHAFPARKGDAKATYAYTNAAGDHRELRADEDGIIRPKDREDERVLESFGLKVVKEEAAEASRSGASRARSGPVLKAEGTRPGDDAGDETKEEG